MTHDASSCVVAVKKAIRQLTLAQGSPLMREFSASWHLVFQNKRDLKKTRNWGHFLSNLVVLRCKNI